MIISVLIDRCLLLFLILWVNKGVKAEMSISRELCGESSTNETCSDMAMRLLKSVPLIDGHVDFPFNTFTQIKNQLHKVDFRQNLTNDPLFGIDSCVKCQTDIPRLKAGCIGAVFLVAYVSKRTSDMDAVGRTMEQIDLIHRFVNKYSNEFQLVTSVQGLEKSFASGKISSMIGLEGGHSIDNKLAVLRLFYELGVRYMTLTHESNTAWADTSVMDMYNFPSQGLSQFGKTVVREMNRLGMMVDLSHVSKQTQLDALQVTRAPVIYSHSSVYAMCNNSRNVHDDVLELVKENKGIVMMSFVNSFLSCSQNATIPDVIRHINYIRRKIGVDYVGIGSDLSGIRHDQLPTGLKDVSKYPDLFAHLAADTVEPWTEDELKKLAGLNLMRVFREVERVRDEMAAEGITPYEDLIPKEQLKNDTWCVSTY